MPPLKTLCKYCNECKDFEYVRFDKNGNLVPIADNEITFSVLGEGELIGSGSADPKSTQGYHHPNHKAWKGKVGAVIKSTGKPGNVIIKAEAIGLKVAQIKLKSQRQK